MTLMTELPEQEIVTRCLAGDDPGHGAFRLLYERYAPEVLRFLRRMLGEVAAEDAMQDTFLRLHRGLKGYDPARPLRPYVLRIARNVAIEALRRRDRLRKLQLDPKAPQDTTRERVEQGERDALVKEAVAALPAEHQSVVVLRYTHGLKLREVAEALSCTPRTARNRLRAAAVLLERELVRRGVVGDDERKETA